MFHSLIKKKKAISHYDSLVDMVSNGYGTALGKNQILKRQCIVTLQMY
jgi:hypothetical protein